MKLFEQIRLKIGDFILRNKMAGTKRKAHYSKHKPGKKYRDCLGCFKD